MMTDYLDHDELKASADTVLKDRCNSDKVLAATDDQLDLKDDLWGLFGDLGWLGIIIPEEYGGIGQRVSELSVIYESMGAFTTPTPYLTTMMFVDAVNHFGPESMRENYFPSIVEGKTSVSMSLDQEDSSLTAKKDGDSYLISGVVRNLLYLDTSTAVLFEVSLEDGGVGYFFVDYPTDGITITSQPTWDRTRRLFHAEFDGVSVSEGRLISTEATAIRMRSRLSNHLNLAVACDSIGGASHTLSFTLDYMKVREQFGRAIASFQALKHRCADHYIGLSLSKALVDDARFSLNDDEASDVDCRLSGAKYFACDNYKLTAVDSVQLQGGISFTWEYPSHLYLKRALFNQVFGWSSSTHKDRIFEALKIRYDLAKAESFCKDGGNDMEVPRF